MVKSPKLVRDTTNKMNDIIQHCGPRIFVNKKVAGTSHNKLEFIFFYFSKNPGILTSGNPKLTDVCLRCACSIFSHPNAPFDLIYRDKQTVGHLLGLAMQSVSNQICVTTILGSSCKVRKFN